MLGKAECPTKNKYVIDYSKELFQYALLYFPWTCVPCGGGLRNKTQKTEP